MAVSTINLNSSFELKGELHYKSGHQITSDTEFLSYLKDMSNSGRIFAILDTTQTMKILAKVARSYLWMIIFEHEHVWNDHPEFIAFEQDVFYTGQLSVTENDYSILYIHKSTGTSL